MLCLPQFIIREQLPGSKGEPCRITPDKPGFAVDHTLDHRADRLHNRRHAHRLRFGNGEAERLVDIPFIKHNPGQTNFLDQLGFVDRLTQPDPLIRQARRLVQNRRHRVALAGAGSAIV